MIIRSLLAAFLLTAFCAAQAETELPPILDESALNTTVNPCENFYQYACGGWIQKVVLPNDKNGVYRAWSDSDDVNDRLLNQILVDFSKGLTQDDSQKKLGQFYSSCMNPDSTASQATLQKLLQEIHDLSDSKNLASLVASLHLRGVDAFFSYSVWSDVNNSKINAGYFDEGGLGLSGREAYLGDPSNPQDQKWKETLIHYQAHIQKMLMLAGYSQSTASKYAPLILEFEKNLASHALSREDRRDPDLTNHPMSFQELQKLSPNFNWKSYFAKLGTANANNLNVAEPEFLQATSNLIASTRTGLLRAYLSWQVIHASAVALGGPVAQENFEFYGKYLRGKKQMEERWKTCTHMVGSGMRDALGKAYVEKTHGAESQAAASQMIDQVKETFRQVLTGLSWLDDSTRQSALLKLSHLNKKVGFPGSWKNYDSLILSDSALENLMSSQIYNSLQNLSQVDQAVDHSLWDMPPWEINAYYDPSMNEFVFPLAQLLPPALDLNASLGANWGALGATLGHEMSHGYDDEGHQYDDHGNLKDWWTDSVKQEFEKKSQCYVEQANQFEALPGLFINGTATLGENLADQGGTLFAYQSYQRLKAQNPSLPSRKFMNFNEDQQFFLAYAQSWCSKLTDESLRLQVQTDPHPPSEFRVNMVLKNMQAFRQAFQCQTGSAMAPEKTCQMWQ